MKVGILLELIFLDYEKIYAKIKILKRHKLNRSKIDLQVAPSDNVLKNVYFNKFQNFNLNTLHVPTHVCCNSLILYY